MAALLVCLCANQVSAQTVRDEAQRLLDEQRERERAESLQRLAPETARASVQDSSTNVDPASLEETEATFQIDSIELTGDSLLSDAVKDELFWPFIGLKLGPRRLDLLLRRINAAYIERGYITTRAYLGEQNLASGRLVITVVMGRVEQVTLNGKPPSFRARSALSVHANEALYLPDVEQSVEQINRLRSQQAQSQILPGSGDGASIVALETHPEKPWRVSAGWDNAGQAESGEHRKTAGVEYDNLLGLWDAWAFNAVRTQATRSELLSLSVPFGYSTVSYAYAHSVSRTDITEDIKVRSESVSHTVALNQVLWRNTHWRHALDASMTLRDSKRRLDDYSMLPQQQGSYRIGTSSLFRAERGAVNFDGAYSHGIKRFGADGDASGLPESSPHNLFEKWSANAAVAWAFNPSIGWRTTLSWQYARMGLPGQEQVFLGGSGSVRGFKEGVFSGDRGGQARNELQWTNALGKFGAEHDLRLDPYIFFDSGYARMISEARNRRISSAGLGLRGNWHGLSGELNLGRPVSIPGGTSLRYEDRVEFSISYQY